MSGSGFELTRFGSYVLLDRIGLGGMAEVFRGRQLGVGGFAKMVAIKRILPTVAEDEDFVEMFVDEAKLAVQMAHANVAQIFDLGEAEGTYYIAMEYVAGLTLRQVWNRARKRRRLLPIAMSCYIMQKVCEGLDYAHRKKDERGQDIGLVHRDVSPQNVLVSFEGEIKVVDFGIAKASAKVSKTQAGILKGKFGYMSPEQVRGYELDNRSDIFACGIILWELLVGDRLFLGGSDFSTLEKVRKVDVREPRKLNAGLAPELEAIVMKALSKNRDDRYAYASQMAEDLQKYLYASGQPFARPDLHRYMKKHFAEEIDAEYDRIERFKGIDLDAIPTANQLARAPTALGAPPELDPAFLENLPVVASNAGPDPAPPAPTAAMPVPGSVPLASISPPHAPTPSITSLPPPPSSSSIPGWVKAVIASLSVLVLISVGMVFFLVFGGMSPDPGAISVEVVPEEVEIYLDGKLVSTHAPFSSNEVTPGAHVLEVKKEGFKPVIKPVKVTSGEASLEAIRLDKLE